MRVVQVTDGYKYSFEGESDKKDFKIVKFNQQWRLLLVDASFEASQQPSNQPAPAPAGTTSPNPAGQYQFEMNNQVPTGPDATIPAPH